MKRIISLLGSVCVFLSANPAPVALAAADIGDAGRPPASNVTITVVMPESGTEPEEPAPEAQALVKLYPSGVTETDAGGVREIIKTYEPRPDEDPAGIPREPFERGGWKYTLTDIVRKETANAETREHTETVTLNTDTKELEKILPLLAPTMEYKTGDGFAGILTLDVASIRVETAGTKTSSYTMSVTREYPRLSSNDTSLIPKTVEEKGRTYTLSGVDWKTGGAETVDYEALPEYYTAAANYTATGTSTKVTGYVTTAAYSGVLARLTQGKTVYTAYFLGEEIRTPLEFAEPGAEKPGTEEPASDPVPVTETPEDANPADEAAVTNVADNRGNGVPLFVIPILGAAAGVLYRYLYKKRRALRNEKNTGAADTRTDADGVDGSGVGG